MICSTCHATLKNVTVHPTLHSFRIFLETIISSHIYRLFTCYSITMLQSFSILLNFSLFQFYLLFNIIHTKPSDGFPNRSWLHRKNNYCAKLILLKQSLLLRMKYVIFIWWFCIWLLYYPNVQMKYSFFYCFIAPVMTFYQLSYCF